MFKWLFKKKGCAKHMNNKLEVIGIDHGWSMMKTISQVFVTGVKEITTTPALFGDVLEYEGKFYKVGDAWLYPHFYSADGGTVPFDWRHPLYAVCYKG